MSVRHRKTFRAFNGKEAFDEPLTRRMPEDYQPTHALATDEDAHMRPAPIGMVYWSSWYESFRRITDYGSTWI